MNLLHFFQEGGIAAEAQRWRRLQSSGVPSYASIVAAVGMVVMLTFTMWCLIKCVSARWAHLMDVRVRQALLKRRNTTDKFRYKNGYSWDYVLAFRIYADDEEITMEQRTWNLKRILAQLASGGLEMRLFYNTMHNTVYCKIRASQMRLMKEASRIDLRLELDEDRLREYARKGNKKLGWGPIMTPDTSIETTLPPFRHISAPYIIDNDKNCTNEDMLKLYKKWPTAQIARISEDFSSPTDKEGSEGDDKGLSSVAKYGNTSQGEDIDGPAEPKYVVVPTGDDTDTLEIDGGGDISRKISVEPVDAEFQIVNHESIFRGVDRLKLIDSIITNHGIGGCYLNMPILQENECVVAYTSLHDQVKLRTLESEWIKVCQMPWSQDTTIVKDYFGEKIGIYFQWLGHYTSWLILAAIMGMVAYVNVQMDDNDPNAVTMPYFACAMALWATLYLESWKRTQKDTAMKWGMIGLEQVEVNRPEFTGLKSKSPVTGQPTLYFPSHLRFKRQLKSFGVIFTSASIVIAALALMFFIRYVVTNTPSISAYANELSSLAIALQIEFLNYYFQGIALTLNDNENHQTETDYGDALIMKAFIFQFLNSFSSLLYVSFMKPYFNADQCVPKFCFYELQATLGTIFMSRLFLHNAVKLVWPLIKTSADLREVKKIDADSDNRHDVSEIEAMFLQPKYDALMGTFNDYAAMVGQFGYMTMFVSAFPMCTVLALVNNYVQLRVDAWTLCQVVQRPDPRSAEDIGLWEDVLGFIGTISVFTNAGLISFTGYFAISYSWPWRIWVFFLVCICILSVKYMIGEFIPDVPNSVVIQMKRQDYLVGKVVNNIDDETTDTNMARFRIRPNFRLKVSDDDPL